MPPKKELDPSALGEFQPFVGYRESERAPQVVVRQTNSILELLHMGVLRNPTHAANYLSGYTIPYLRAAEDGSNAVFEALGSGRKPLDLETRESSHHAFVTFAWMHEVATSPFLEHGFSRGGMLKAPETREKFLQRIQELKVQLALIATGQAAPHEILEVNLPRLRTHAFFKVGSVLPLHLPESKQERREKQEEVEQQARAAFEKLLGDVDIPL